MLPSVSQSLSARQGPRPSAARWLALLLGALLAIAIGACGGPSGATASSSFAASGPAITVRDAWVRPGPAGAQSAAYLTITNSGAADRLVAVTCTIAGSAMLHQTTTDPSGMTGMSMLADLPIPAGGSVTLRPGGAHIMLTGLSRALVEGSVVELGLVFESAGTVTVSAAVATR
jgi:periplasmic copper chaperone A